MPAKPSDKSLDDLISTLKKHIEPTPSILAKRFTFHCRRPSQGNLENIGEYVAELKQLATHCKFEAYLDETFRNRFVFRLKNVAIHRNCWQKDAEFYDSSRDCPEYGKRGPTGKNDEGGREPELEI